MQQAWLDYHILVWRGQAAPLSDGSETSADQLQADDHNLPDNGQGDAEMGGSDNDYELGDLGNATADKERDNDPENQAGSPREEQGQDCDSEGGSGDEKTDSDANSNIDLDNLPYNESPIQSPAPPSPPSSPSAQSDETIHLQEEFDQFGNRIYVQYYKVPTVGEPIRRATRQEMAGHHYPDVGKLSKRENFDLAKLRIDSGMSAKYRSKLFRLARFRGQSPWPNSRAMMKDIDKLPHGAGWSVQALAIEGDRGVEIVKMWLRDALEIIKRLLRNKRLGKFMQWKAIKKWKTPEMTDQIRDEIHTADWMWEIQAEIKDEHGTIIPVIISSDKTKLTTFSGDKKAHPVYLTIGNIPKRLRRKTSKRANILLGYLPVPKLDCETSEEERRYHRRNLFHTSKACKDDIEVVCADGGIRRIYPVLAAYIADFIEQCKVACIKQTHCPLCSVDPQGKGDLGNAPPRTHDEIIDAMDGHREEGSANFERLGLYNVDLFWKDFPYLRVEYLMTPDLLHQLHKGVLKDHLTSWITKLLGKQVIDERHSTMPEYHGMRHFKNGITRVSQWTGRELKEMAKTLLPIISDMDRRVVTAARPLLDFAYLAHSSSLSDSELRTMEESLRTFHANKHVFQELGALKMKHGFHGIPKIHMIQHYIKLIQMLGTPDRYNTETSERLHIDFAKMGYRASNKVNAIKQMAMYIQRIEALAMHDEHLEEAGSRSGVEVIDDGGLGSDGDSEWDEWEDVEDVDDLEEQSDAEVRLQLEVELDRFLSDGVTRVGGQWQEEPPVEHAEDANQETRRFHPVPEIVTAKTAMASTTLGNLQTSNDAPRLLPSLHTFVRKIHPQLTNLQIQATLTPATKVPIWTCACLFHSPPPFKPLEGPHIDVIRAQPVKIDHFQHVCRPARFDMVLIRNRNPQGYRPARIRAIFELPERLHHICDQKLAYVELFNVTSQNPNAPTGLFTTARSISNGVRSTSVVPLSDIAMTCHLAPRYRLFQPEDPLNQHSDVLQLCDHFFVNIFATYFLFELFRHWDQAGQTG
ncbi:plasma membrane ATPase 4 [Ceratobasidium sp. AG-Ba]|nr:plasma membrane ATPase 4 [Ceratobasidium sp. AG-Ba]